MRVLTLGLCGWALLSLWSAPAQALATYVYEGNFFDTVGDSDFISGSYHTSMRVTVELTLPAPLGPNLEFEIVTDQILSGTLSDGRQTFTDIVAAFSTDAAGDITAWAVTIPLLLPQTRDAGTLRDVEQAIIPTQDYGFIRSSIIPGGDGASITDAPGTWTLVPEPATALLLGTGLALLGASGVRRARQAKRSGVRRA